MVKYQTTSRRIFVFFLYIALILFSLSIILPFMHVISVSFSSKDAIIANRVTLLPADLFTGAYKVILESKIFLTSLGNTVLLTGVSTSLTIVVAVCAAYALANRHFFGTRTAMVYVLIPMYFTGGLIPFYLLVNSLGLNNNRLALILPYLVNPFYIIVFRNAITRLPKEIVESAEIDGASEAAILFRIVLYLILPLVAAFAIFAGVAAWNTWFPVLLFIRDKAKWTLQYLLRSIYTNPTLGDDTLTGGSGAVDETELLPQNLVNAAIVCTVIPILVIYPFLQRYFIHGVIVGAVKE